MHNTNSPAPVTSVWGSVVRRLRFVRDNIYTYIRRLRDNSWGALFSQGLSCGQKISPTANCPVGGVWHGLFEFF